jgi:eukaryotic-like serine/threonine-protein kinase
MDPARWERIKAVFQDAFEKDPAERAALLAAACGDDADMRMQAERLLTAHGSVGTFLDAPLQPETRSASLLGERERSAESLALQGPKPERIGAYRIVRELGRGGMGTVYLAERDDAGFKKTVAIKVVSRDSHVMMRRFRTETQILATLEHPGIARLYDGGTTEEGLPYFVMEYVGGENIVAYCERHHLSIADRLRLFRRVCEAVQFAHQSFIVHRDLKPSNILVTADAEPKLLDFGIAKLLNPELAGGPVEETMEMTRLLTPQYASPEHVRGQPVTTASDVYSLGVILYELLTGARPYRITNAQSTAEIERAVCETDAAPPSAVAPSARRRELRGDLDNIVLKALRKAPAERYGTAAELAEDIRRHVERFPVQAQPDRVAYRAGKFMRRHRAAVAAAAITAASLVAGLGVALWQARVARAERDRAAAETAKAQQVAGFLSSVFQGANPVLARGKTVTARELLDQASTSIETKLKDEPDVQASLLLVIADAYRSLTLFDKSAELAERALALREQAFPPRSLEVAEALLMAGRMQGRVGRAARAVPFLERALSVREDRLGPNDRAVAEVLIDLAITRSSMGHDDGNREMLQRAVDIFERTAPASARLAYAYNCLGAYFYNRRDYDRARAAYQRSIAVYEKSDEAESWGVAMPLVNLGDVLLQQGDFDAARPFFERAMAIDVKTFGKESQGVAYALGRLGDLARATGDLARAFELLHRSLAIYAKTVPADHYEIADVTVYLGRALVADGKPREALAQFERALRIQEQTHGRDFSEVAEVLVELGRARAAAEGPAVAEPALRRALTIQRHALSAESEALVPTLTALGQVLARQHKAAEARPLLEEAVRIAGSRLPERHSDRLEAEAALADLNGRVGS